MGGSDTTDSDGDSGSTMGRIIGSLENKVVLLIMSVLLGVSGNQVLTQLNPDTVRPDPWTGTEAKDAHKEILAKLDHEVEDLQDELRWLRNTLQAHLVRGEAGFSMIGDLERRVELLERPGNE